MGSVNKVILVGNLGRDAELKYTPSGAAVANFSLAATETWKDKDGAKQERTEWCACVFWGKAAEGVAEYLTKGKQVYVEGKMQTRTWEKDGAKHYKTEVKVDRLVLLGKADGARTQPRDDDEGYQPTTAAAQALADDDIPF